MVKTDPAVRMVSAKVAAAKAAKMLLLIEAAEDIFISKGYHSATMSDVARAAGMSKKTVYQLIESKTELFISMLAHYQSLLVFPAAEPGCAVKAILVQNLLYLANFLLVPKQIAIIRLIMAEYSHQPDLGRAFHRGLFRRAKTKLDACLTEITGDRHKKIDDIGEMADMLFGMTIGEYYLRVLVGFRSAPTKTMIENRIRLAVDVFLAGNGCNDD